MRDNSQFELRQLISYTTPETNTISALYHFIFSESDSEEEVLEGSDVHDVILKRDGANQSLGLSIRGGSEHGLGVYVSDVTPDSIAGGYSADVLILCQ